MMNTQLLSRIILLYFISLFFSSDSLLGQTYSIQPNDTIQTSGMMNDFEQLSIQQKNISSNPIIIKWKKVSENVPKNWAASVCDNKICYTSLVDSGIMNPIAPNNTGFLLTDITPQINDGTAIIRYAIWDTAFPNNVNTLTYIHSVNKSGIESEIHNNLFNLSPNPSSDQIILRTSFDIGSVFIIEDIVGRTILSGIISSNTMRISLSALNTGVYIFQIQSKQKFYSQKFIKN